MWCACSNSLSSCSDCHEKYVVMADVDFLETEYFCFDTCEEAWDCFECIEKYNTYAGFRFLPKTAVLMKSIGYKPDESPNV